MGTLKVIEVTGKSLFDKMDYIIVDTDRVLEELNDEKAAQMTPVIVYLVILMVMGLIGNTMVCVFYSCKSRQSSNTVFIVAVGVYDLLFCGLSIPIEIVDVRLFYMFKNSGACRLLRFVSYFVAGGSIFMLLVISVDRYRKICQPFKKQLKVRDAKIACGISVLVSLVFSWPALLLYRSVSVDVITDDGYVLEGFDCTTIRDDDFKIYLWIFNGFYFVSFVISSVVLCVMYGLVCRVLFRHNWSLKRCNSRPLSSNSNSGGTDGTQPGLNHPAETDNSKYKVNDTRSFQSESSNRKCVVNILVSENPNVSEKSKNQHQIKTVKFTSTMLVITLVFIISFLPHLSLNIWRAFVKEYEVDTLSDSGLVAFQIGLRSYFLNSAINPLTYGFFNPKFREFFYVTFCRCYRKKSEGNTVSTSSGAT